jgi:hypothetical protein
VAAAASADIPQRTLPLPSALPCIRRTFCSDVCFVCAPSEGSLTWQNAERAQLRAHCIVRSGAHACVMCWAGNVVSPLKPLAAETHSSKPGSHCVLFTGADAQAAHAVAWQFPVAPPLFTMGRVEESRRYPRNIRRRRRRAASCSTSAQPPPAEL